MNESTDRGVMNEQGKREGRPFFRDEVPPVVDDPTVVLPAGPPVARPFPPTQRRAEGHYETGPVEPGTAVLPISQLPDSTGYLPPAKAAHVTTVPPPAPAPPRVPVPSTPAVPPAPPAKRVKQVKEPRARRPRNWRRRLGIAAAVSVLVPTGLYLLADSQLARVDAMPTGARPGVTPGTDWLIVGSDSREGLTKAERRELATGKATGRRTDMMMLLHVPESGAPTLVSLPRDSYVPIAGHGKDRLNAAYAYGGAPLLVQTVENATGIRIDHYAEIGMGGVFDMVNAVGGVKMCVDSAVTDVKAGLKLSKGCQNLDGAEALGYARSRNSTRGDLDRVNHQRELMMALMNKAASVGTLANPFKSVPLVKESVESLKVDGGDHLYDLARLGFAARSLGSDGVMTTVPIGAEFTANGAAVMSWDPTLSERLFSALRQDKPVPRSVIRA